MTDNVVKKFGKGRGNVQMASARVDILAELMARQVNPMSEPGDVSEGR